ncbi:MAG: hypothetical protein ACK511_14915 [Burkholderiales bacterium]|nr:hypothetical protein [Betaproteobacteria bacterium]
MLPPRLVNDNRLMQVNVGRGKLRQTSTIQWAIQRHPFGSEPMFESAEIGRRQRKAEFVGVCGLAVRESSTGEERAQLCLWRFWRHVAQHGYAVAVDCSRRGRVSV